MIDNNKYTYDQFSKTIQDLFKEGLLVITGFKNGEPMYAAKANCTLVDGKWTVTRKNPPPLRSV